MALTLATQQVFNFEVIGDGASTVIVVDLGAAPFALPLPIKRVTSFVVSGISGLTATRAFSGTQVTITFSAPWVGVAVVDTTVLI